MQKKLFFFIQLRSSGGGNFIQIFDEGVKIFLCIAPSPSLRIRLRQFNH